MARLQIMGRDGCLRIYDGSSPLNYVEVVFEKMDFAGPLAKPRPLDPIIATMGGYAHAPDSDSYEKVLYEPLPLSFSCSLDLTTNTWKLRDALCNPDLDRTWKVGSATWTTTKGRGSIVLPDGSFTATLGFFDVMKKSVDIEVLFANPNAVSPGSASWGIRYSEVYFPPQEQSISESPDEVALKATGQIYGNITQIGGFRPGNES